MKVKIYKPAYKVGQTVGFVMKNAFNSGEDHFVMAKIQFIAFNKDSYETYFLDGFSGKFSSSDLEYIDTSKDDYLLTVDLK